MEKIEFPYPPINAPTTPIGWCVNKHYVIIPIYNLIDIVSKLYETRDQAEAAAEKECQANIETVSTKLKQLKKIQKEQPWKKKKD